MGFLSFLGVVLACPSCFLGLLGFSAFLVRSAPACWGWGRVAGVPGFGVWRARAACFLFVGGGSVACFLFVEGGSGVRLRAPEWLASSLLGGAGSGVCASPGSCCVVVGVGLCPVSCSCSRCCCSCSRGVFGCCFFPSGASRVLLVSGVGLRGLAGGRGVVGGVGLGSGLFFLRLLLYWPGLVSGFLLWGAGLGLGWVLFGEFDPGSGRTLAACLTHASRTGPPFFLGGGLSGERVSIT